MDYINKFETTEEFNQAKDELSKLEHYMAYDAQVNEIFIKPFGYFFVITSKATNEIIKKRNYNGISDDFIQLESGRNRIENADYGFVCNGVGNNTIISFDFFNYKTNYITNMQSMFYECSGLTTLDLSNFDTYKTSNFWAMFRDCSKLSKIKCKQAFKDWCIANKDEIDLPDTMINGTVGAVGSGSNWEIVDYQG